MTKVRYRSKGSECLIKQARNGRVSGLVRAHTAADMLKGWFLLSRRLSAAGVDPRIDVVAQTRALHLSASSMVAQVGRSDQASTAWADQSPRRYLQPHLHVQQQLAHDVLALVLCGAPLVS